MGEKKKEKKNQNTTSKEKLINSVTVEKGSCRAGPFV